jgi:predicted kinase
VGSTGAGKTTYSRKLASEISAVVYSIDNWMKAMFGADMPSEPQPSWFHENHEWYVERIARCEEMILELVKSRALLSQPSILDLGFSTKEHRKKFIDRLSSEGIAVRIQFLDVDAEERKQRVEKRNQEKGETFMMTVDDSLFDFMENLFEAPSEEEGVPVQVV